ncbi:MAG: phosphorelay protein [Nitrososphaeria archaeon]|nr:phosphorelay protein [Nitrososphaeria archaeon]NDF25487.1 phosphorelay protein [Nitrososphaerota archaeon]NDF30411.1 phosphorelay protein [Nitrososphaeria archaeon]
MSEEFLRVAKLELGEDITKIGILISGCSTDADVLTKTADIEKHIHKIKGLAPMMGQEHTGNIAALLDKILKTMLAGKSVSGIYNTMILSHDFMKNALDGKAENYDALTQKIQTDHKDLL